MKHIFLIALSFFLLKLITSAKAVEGDQGSSMKLEGSCSGKLADGTAVSLAYYSDFDGYKKISQSAVTFSEGIEGLYTGHRSFKNGKDHYQFPQHKIIFADSTGNTSGNLFYKDINGTNHIVEIQCDIRDYTYV